MGKAQTDFHVTGILGPGLVSRAEELLSGVAGVEYAHVNLGAGKATVSYDDSITSADALTAVLETAGYGVTRK